MRGIAIGTSSRIYLTYHIGIFMYIVGIDVLVTSLWSRELFKLCHRAAVDVTKV